MARVAYKTPSDYRPEQGNRELPLLYDFGAAASYADDLTPEIASSMIEMVQSVFVDNFDNLNPLVIQFFYGCNQRIVVPAQTQGTFPVIVPGYVKYTISTTIAANLNVRVIWSNVKRDYQFWGPITVTANIAAINPVVANMADFSGTIAAGGVSQVVIAANPNRKRIIVHNPTSEIETLFLDFGTAAVPGTSIAMAPGGVFDSLSGPVSGQSVNLRAATLGHAYVVKEQ